MTTSPAPSADSYLGPIGSLDDTYQSLTSYQVSSDGSTLAFVIGMNSAPNSSGTYDWDVYSIGTNGALNPSPVHNGHHWEAFYDVLLGIEIPNSTQASSTPTPAFETDTSSSGSSGLALVTPMNKTLLFGHSLTKDQDKGGYRTFLSWVDSDGNIGDVAEETYWEHSYPYVSTFRMADTQYLFMQQGSPNSDGTYDWKITEITSKGEFGDVKATGSWDSAYSTMCFFTVFSVPSSDSDGPTSPSSYPETVYCYGNAATENDDSKYKWFLAELDDDFSWQDDTHSGSGSVLYRAGSHLRNPITGNNFLFLIAEHLSDSNLAWEMIQLTDGSQITGSKPSASSTLITPKSVATGNAFVPYGLFTPVSVNGLAYLFALSDVENSDDTYYYTVQSVLKGGTLAPASITAQYLQEMVSHNTMAGAHANAASSMPSVSLTSGDAVKYAKEVTSEQQSLQTNTATWTSDRADDLYDILSTFVDTQGELESYISDAKEAQTAFQQFSTDHPIVIFPSGTEKTMSGAQWLKACYSQVSTDMDAFLEVKLKDGETLAGIVNNVLDLLAKYQAAGDSFNKSTTSFAATINTIAKNLDEINEEVKKLEDGDSGQISDLTKEISANEAALKSINKQLQNWLSSALGISIGGSAVSAIGACAVYVAIKEAGLKSWRFAGNFVGLVVFLGVVIYEAVEMMKEYEHLVSEQEKLTKDIANERAEVAEIKEEVAALDVLSSVSASFAENLVNITSTVEDNSGSLTSIADDLKNANQSLSKIQTVTQDDIQTWLEKASPAYSDDVTLSYQDCYNWSFLVGSKMAMIYTGVPASINGTLSALSSAVQLALQLQASSQLTLEVASLSDINSKEPVQVAAQ